MAGGPRGAATSRGWSEGAAGARPRVGRTAGPAHGSDGAGACAGRRRGGAQPRGGLNRLSVPWRPVSVAGVQPGALPGGTAAPDQSHIGGGSTPAWQRSHRLQPWCGVWVVSEDGASADGTSACAWQGGVPSARVACVGASVSAPASATAADAVATAVTAVCTAMDAQAQLRTGSSAISRHSKAARQPVSSRLGAVWRAGAA